MRRVPHTHSTRYQRHLERPRRRAAGRCASARDRALWDEYTRAYEDAFSACSTEWAPWYVVPADDKSVRNYLVTQVMVETLERMAPEYPSASPSVLRYIDKIE